MQLKHTLTILYPNTQFLIKRFFGLFQKSFVFVHSIE